MKSKWSRVVFALGASLLAAGVGAPAQSFTTLVNFNLANGANPQFGPPVQGYDGEMYGMTSSGGNTTFCPSYGCGTVFKVSTTGVLTSLYDFNVTHGSEPFGSLALNLDGNFYGTTGGGGINGNGTVFRVTPTGKLTTLFSFNYYVNGAGPFAGLVLGTDGNFYGTTTSGGANGFGTIFRVSPEGKLTILHGFNYGDGYFVFGTLVQARDGSLYGASYAGGTSGVGTVFKLAPDGTFTVLHNFDNTDGAYAYGSLIQATDGNFYGTTQTGGAYGQGTVFKITSAGDLTTIHSFNVTDGANPTAGLIEAADGRFYGTTVAGGSDNLGTVFDMTSTGTLRTLHSFDGSDGSAVYGGLAQSTNGNLYGMTNSGGSYDYGTVFGVSGHLSPFVETVPVSGKVGASVLILGTDLKESTSATFNGTPATFKVVSGSLISTTVPAGATTGPVQVVTPSGTLTSNVNFQVPP